MTPSEYTKQRGITLPLVFIGQIAGYTRDGLSKLYHRDLEKFNLVVDSAWEKFKSICV